MRSRQAPVCQAALCEVGGLYHRGLSFFSALLRALFCEFFMQLKSFGAVALASLALATSAHAAEPTPQAVTDLFLKSIVHIDVKSMEALNAYLRPARTFPGQGDFINVAEMQEVDRDYPKDLAATFLENVRLSDADKQALEPAAVQLFANVRDSQKRITCTLGKPQNVTEGVHPAMVAVNVPFNCLAPNPPEKIVAFLQRAGAAQWNLQQYREQVQALAKGFEAAPLTQAWEGELPLAAEKKKKPLVWQNNFPRESIDVTPLQY